MNERKIGLIVIVLSLIGVAICVYLTNMHQQISNGTLSELSLCSFNRHFNCEAVSASPYSSWYGVPVAWLGAMLYVLWFFLACTAVIYTKKHATKAFGFIFLSATLAVLIDVYFAWIMVAVIEKLCLFCLISYALNLSILLLTGYLWRKHHYNLAQTCLSIIPFSPRASYGFMFIFIVVASVGIVKIPELQHVQDQQLKHFDVKAFQEYQATAKRFKIDTSTDPFSGTEKPLLTIVEFSDFQCPLCRKTHIVLQTILPIYHDRVKFVFKNMPLGLVCNDLLAGRELHSSACALAQLGEAAHVQGKFWQMHDVIFEHQEEFQQHAISKYGLWTLAQEANLDLTQLNHDFPKQETAVQQDMKAAAQVHVQGTPSFFFNGLAIQGSLSPKVLQKIIELELKYAADSSPSQK